MIGAKIRSLRVEKGLTLTELAEKAGIAKSYLSNIERNLQNNPTFEYINKIARALDVEQERLLFEADSVGNSDLQTDLMNLKKALAQMGDYQLEELIDYIEFTMWKRKQMN